MEVWNNGDPIEGIDTSKILSRVNEGREMDDIALAQAWASQYSRVFSERGSPIDYAIERRSRKRLGFRMITGKNACLCGRTKGLKIVYRAQKQIRRGEAIDQDRSGAGASFLNHSFR
jgi:hypothetical protein